MAQESTPQVATSDCPANTICLSNGASIEDGQSWQWSPGDGFKDLPTFLHDNVDSFVANADGVFIADGVRRIVRRGDYRVGYRQDFGGRMDAIDRL